MNRKATLAIASAIVSIASIATTAAAANTTTDTHAYLETERTRTDGQVEPINVGRERAGASDTVVVAQPTAMDAWFASQRSLTEGNTDVAFDAGGASRQGANPFARLFRGRAN
jgi:hypothetical protein